MKFLVLLLLSYIALFAQETFNTWFSEGTVKGNIKYYYIETNKNFISSIQTSAHSNALGGQLEYTTSTLNGWKLGTTFMTTNAFLLPDNVESSTIGQDNGIRGKDPTQSYSVLGEVYAEYSNSFLELWYGRRVITTPMIGAKKVRMLPSAIEGSEVNIFVDEKTNMSISYLQGFKQRSSDTFSNIIEHALGTDTYTITGSKQGYAFAMLVNHKEGALELNVYDLYAVEFLNTAYIDLTLKQDFFTLSSQLVSQNSIGNADTNLAKTDSVTKGKRINASAFGMRAKINYKESSFDLVYRNVFRKSSAYDSIITPWDGTLLYAYSSTTNNLGQSLYGKGLSAGGAYVGGTQGVKLGYTQKYDYTGTKGFKTHLAYARYQNSLYREDQEDLKAILAYDIDSFSIQLKGIWINNDTYTFKDGTVNQLDSLTQYHAIVNYKF